jgi:hypothetical protein
MRYLAFASGIESVVIYTLRDENEISEAEIDCECSDCRYKAGKEGSSKVCYISEEPDAQEKKTDTICGALVVIFNQLGYLHTSSDVSFGVSRYWN